jgi:hypothetical protein
MSPFTAKVTIAPPTKIQISVGVRSTMVVASRNSSNAVAATRDALAVRASATGTRRATVHAMPTLTNAANTAASTWDGASSTTVRTAPTSAPIAVSARSGLARRRILGKRSRYHADRAAPIGSGGRRCGSRNWAASTARISPGIPMIRNA